MWILVHSKTIKSRKVWYSTELNVHSAYNCYFSYFYSVSYSVFIYFPGTAMESLGAVAESCGYVCDSDLVGWKLSVGAACLYSYVHYKHYNN